MGGKVVAALGMSRFYKYANISSETLMCLVSCVRCRSSIPRGINEGRRTPDPTEMEGEGERVGDGEQEERGIEQRMCVLLYSGARRISHL